MDKFAVDAIYSSDMFLETMDRLAPKCPDCGAKMNLISDKTTVATDKTVRFMCLGQAHVLIRPTRCVPLHPDRLDKLLAEQPDHTWADVPKGIEQSTPETTTAAPVTPT